MPAFLTCALVLCAYLMSILALSSSKAVRVSAFRLAVILLPVALIVLAAIFLQLNCFSVQWETGICNATGITSNGRAMASGIVQIFLRRIIPQCHIFPYAISVR